MVRLSWIEISNLKHVSPSLGSHWKSEKEEENADPEGEKLSNGPQGVGPHVHDAGDQALHDAELAVDADGLEK